VQVVCRLSSERQRTRENSVETDSHAKPWLIVRLCPGIIVFRAFVERLPKLDVAGSTRSPALEVGLSRQKASSLDTWSFESKPNARRVIGRRAVSVVERPSRIAARSTVGAEVPAAPACSRRSPVTGMASAEERCREWKPRAPAGSGSSGSSSAAACWRTASRGCGEGRCPSTSS
jgi:hypothetical protein